MRITAHGFGVKWRLFTGSDQAPDVAQTVDVVFDVKANGGVSREVSFAHLLNIRTFDVNSVAYADGSSWHAPSPGACKVDPIPFVLIGAQ